MAGACSQLPVRAIGCSSASAWCSVEGLCSVASSRSVAAVQPVSASPSHAAHMPAGHRAFMRATIAEEYGLPGTSGGCSGTVGGREGTSGGCSGTVGGRQTTSGGCSGTVGGRQTTSGGCSGTVGGASFRDSRFFPDRSRCSRNLLEVLPRPIAVVRERREVVPLPSAVLDQPREVVPLPSAVSEERREVVPLPSVVSIDVCALTLAPYPGPWGLSQRGHRGDVLFVVAPVPRESGAVLQRFPCGIDQPGERP
jgi:hypothetical protein